jgi:hypothetical protein
MIEFLITIGFIFICTLIAYAINPEPFQELCELFKQIKEIFNESKKQEKK